MHTITLLPSCVKRDFPKGTPLWEALLDMGVMLRTPCGGKGTCGKCSVSVKQNGTGKIIQKLACKELLEDDLKVIIEEKRQTGTDPDVLSPIKDQSQNNSFAFAVDIGTTTVKMSLVDTASGLTYDLTSFLNPQRRFGHDVISRISAASCADKRNRMTALIREAIHLVANEALRISGILPKNIKGIMVSGNTTMLSIFYGIDPTPIGHAPYVAPVLDFPLIKAPFLGFDDYENASVMAIPARAAFLGSDLVAGLAVCHDAGFSQNTFFIDLGTNGELFISNASGDIAAASCAMGPALEGMAMSCGMTADEGAITHIREAGHGLEYEMIGSSDPRGITGTAMIELAAILLDKNAIAKTGMISQTVLPHPASYFENDGVKGIRLWEDISFTQKDIRNLQLAKAASLSAAVLLKEKTQADENDINHVIVAGAIGEHLNIESFKRLGFIPEFRNAEWIYLGNTSLKAAKEALLDIDYNRKSSILRDRIREIELANEPDFQSRFLNAIDFP